MNEDDDIIPEGIRTMADIPPPPPPSSPLKSATTTTTTPLLNTPKISHGEDHINTVQGGGTISTTTTSSTMASPASPSTNNPTASATLLSPPLLLEIEEGTPAAEALRANADVRVSKLRKVGRSTKLQAGVRVIKSSVKMASGQPGHASDRRGAPAFVAPKSSTPNASSELRKSGSASSGGQIQLGGVAAAPPTIPEVDDEGGDGAAAAIEESSDELLNNLGSDTKLEGGESPSIIAAVIADQEGGDNDSFGSAKIEGGGGTSSVTSAEFLAQQNYQQQQNNIQHMSGGSASNRHSSTMQHVTHAALPAAIAAACRAGEELDRQRASQLEKCSSEGGGLDSASLNTAPSRTIMSPFTSIFRSSAYNLSMEKLDNDQNEGIFNASKSTAVKHTTPRPNRIHIRSASVPSGIGVFRRTSMENQHRMPSEISVGAEETQRHGNLRLDDDISDDDGDQMIATTAQIAKIPPSGCDGDSPSKTKLRKHVEMDPIVVEIPGRRPSFPDIVEETKEEEEQQMALLSEEGEGGEESESRKALMTKAKKKISRRSTKKKSGLHDDDTFHFHGPKQVRKWVKQRRHREESKNQRSYVKGKVIDGQHELYTMSIAVMFGMRTSIGRTNLEMSQTAHNERRWLDNEDLMAVVKYEFPPKVSIPHCLPCAMY